MSEDFSEEEISEPEEQEEKEEEEDEDSDIEIITETMPVKVTNRRITSPYMTKYERAKIINKRANELRSGAVPYIHVPTGKSIMASPLTIAEMELYNYKLPYKINRKLPNGKVEIWTIANPGIPGNLILPLR